MSSFLPFFLGNSELSPPPQFNLLFLVPCSPGPSLNRVSPILNWKSINFISIRVPWTAKRSNQSILKEINPEYSSEGLMLKLKLQYFGTWREELTHWKRPWCWGRRKGGEGDDRGWDGWMAASNQWTGVRANFRRWWRTEKPGVLLSVGLQRGRHSLATE